MLALVNCPLTTHPFRDKAPSLLPIETRPTFGRSLRLSHILHTKYYIEKIRSSYPPSRVGGWEECVHVSFAACLSQLTIDHASLSRRDSIGSILPFPSGQRERKVGSSSILRLAPMFLEASFSIFRLLPMFLGANNLKLVWHAVLALLERFRNLPSTATAA